MEEFDDTITKVNYNDRYFRIVLSLLAAHIIVMYNETDSFLEALFTETYIRGLIASFVIAWLLTTYIHFISVRLDRRYDWHRYTLQRIFWQSLLGFAAPALLAFLLVALFFRCYNINIFDTDYLRQDYTVVLFMLLAFNIYYFGLNSFLALRQRHHGLQVKPDSNSTEITASQEITPESLKENAPLPQIKEVIVVDTLTQTIPVKTETISYCFILQGSVFVRSIDMANMEDSYRLTYNLKELEDTLDKRLFFRINRRMIVNFNACRYYKPAKNKTLELMLEPTPYLKGAKIPSEHERLCIVSEDRVAAFRIWMDR